MNPARSNQFQRPNYQDSGFNGFFRRSINSNAGVQVLTNMASQAGGNYASKELNFDNIKVSGALGDILRVGKINLDGVKGRISVFDDDGNETTRLGELDG